MSTRPDSTESDKILSRLLRSPYALTPRQLRKLRAIVADLSLRICAARKNSASQKRAIEQREKCRSLLAPVRRLPPELLDHIFALYGRANCNKIGDLNEFFLPGFVFMAVCKRWRVIAESCFSLWSNISISVFFTELPHLQALEWCLDHSGGSVPLDFSLSTRGRPGSHDICLLERLFSQVSRWRCVTIEHSNDYDINMYPPLPTNSLESLESLSLQYSPVWGYFTCGIARKLSKLSLRGHLPSDNLEGLPSSRTQIEELNLGLDLMSTAPSHMFQILSLFPATKTLKYWFHCDPNWYDDFEREITELELDAIPSQASSSVVSLYIRIQMPSAQPYHLGSLLDASFFPNLKTLSVQFFAWYTYEQSVDNVTAIPFWPEKSLTAFLLRSKCSLTSLDIGNALITDADIVSLLKHTPDLQHLTLSQASRHDYVYFEEIPSDNHVQFGEVSRYFQKSLTMGFIKQLYVERRRTSGTTVLVPKLCHLSLRVFGDWFDDDKLFVDVILSRWRSDQAESLKSLELKVLGRPLDEEAYKRLMVLDGREMRVEVFGSA